MLSQQDSQRAPIPAEIDLEAMQLDGVPAAPQLPQHTISPTKFVLLLTLIYAMTEASQTALGMKNEDRLFTFACIAISFINSFASNKRTMLDGFKESYKVAKTGQLPEDLPVISANKKTAAILIAGAVTLYVATSDSVQNYYFGNAIPDEYPEYKLNATAWIIPTILMTATTALNAVFSEGLKTYRFVHEAIAGKRVEYANNVSRIVSPILGCTLGAISGVNDALLSLVGTTSAFKFKNGTPVYVLTGTSCMSGTSELALQSFYLTETANDIIGTLARRYPTPKEILSSVVSLGLSGFDAMAKRKLSNELLSDVATLYEMNPSAGLVSAAQVYAYAAALTYTIITGMYLYPLVESTADGFSAAFKFTRDNLTSDATLRQRDLAELAINYSEKEPLLNQLPPAQQTAQSRAINDIPLRRPGLFFERMAPRLGYRVEDETLRSNSRPS